MKEDGNILPTFLPDVMRLPPVFAKVPRDLFRPLASQLSELYWEVLLLTYRKRFHSESGTELLKSELLDAVEQYLTDNNVLDQDLSELEEDAFAALDPRDTHGAARRYATLLLRRLETCRWLYYEYRKENNGYVVRLPEYTWRIVKVLEDIAISERAGFRSLAYPVRQAVSDAGLQKNSPDVFVETLKRSVGALISELKILADNIGQYIEDARQKDQTKDLLAHHGEYQKHVVQHSYSAFKTIDNVHRYRVSIIENLEKLIIDNDFLRHAGAKIAESKGLVGREAECTDVLLDDLERMARNFRDIEALTNSIDEKNRRYLQTTINRMRHDLVRDESVIAKLSKLVGIRKVEAGMGDLCDALVQYSQVELPDVLSLYTPPKTINHSLPAYKPPPSVSPEDRERRKMEELELAAKTITREKIYRYSLKLLGTRDEIVADDIPVETDKDLVYFISLHAYRNDADAPYRIVSEGPPERFIKKGPYSFRACRIQRRSVPPAGLGKKKRGK